MNTNRLLKITVFLLIIVGSLSSCEKLRNLRTNELIEIIKNDTVNFPLRGTQWRLIEVSIRKNYQLLETIDCLDKNIIYDFQRNTLIIIGNIPDSLFVFDDFQIGEHFYEYNEYRGDPPVPNLCIDKKYALGDPKGCYYCDFRNDTMRIVGDRIIGGVMDESGMIVGGDSFHWGKIFILKY